MCGIVGRFGIKKPETVVNTCRDAWSKMAHRGTDSYGLVIGLSDGRIWYAKSLNSDALLERVMEEIGDKEICWFVGHNRKASVGGISIELAHPIICTETGYAVIHNGTKKELAGTFGTNSDTQALPRVFKYVDEKIRHTVLNGVGVVFAFHKDGYIWFHKDKSRPLHIKKMKHGYLFSSEPLHEGKWAPIKEVTVKLNDISELVNYAGNYVHVGKYECAPHTAKKVYTYTYHSNYATYSIK